MSHRLHRVTSPRAEYKLYLHAERSMPVTMLCTVTFAIPHDPASWHTLAVLQKALHLPLVIIINIAEVFVHHIHGYALHTDLIVLRMFNSRRHHHAHALRQPHVEPISHVMVTDAFYTISLNESFGESRTIPLIESHKTGS